jgi:type I restriction enzyme S subunit
LELAVRGKLVPKDANDEPASELLKRIQAEKARLIAEGKIKNKSPSVPLLQRGKITASVPHFEKGGLGGISGDEMPYPLPQGWEWVRLGEITNFGSTEKLGIIADKTWVLDLEDIEKDTSRLLQKFRFSERNSLSDKNSFLAGDVLYGKLRPYLNKVIVADEDGVCTTEILPVRCYGPFSSHYFKFALKSPNFINYVNARSYGMKMPRLGTEDGRKAPFPLPPLAEQHRIVAKVDELMALCDQLETQHNNAAEAHEKLVSHLLGTLTQSQSAADFSANWQRIAAHFNTLFTTETSIDALKQTLLQLAVMGKLVSQDPKDEPASDLLKHIQAENAKLLAEGKIRKGKPLLPISEDDKAFILPHGWGWVRLGQIGDWGAGATPLRSNTSYYGGNTSWFKSGELTADFIDTSEETITELALKECSLRLNQPGDVLLAMYGATIGKSAILKIPGTTNQAVCACTPNTGVYNRYLLVLLKAMKSNFIGQGAGGAQPNISREKIIATVAAIPPTAEQHRIVAKADELMALCDQMKSRLTAANQLQQKLADVMVEQAVA